MTIIYNEGLSEKEIAELNAVITFSMNAIPYLQVSPMTRTNWKFIYGKTAESEEAFQKAKLEAIKKWLNFICEEVNSKPGCSIDWWLLNDDTLEFTGKNSKYETLGEKDEVTTTPNSGSKKVTKKSKQIVR